MVNDQVHAVVQGKEVLYLKIMVCSSVRCMSLRQTSLRHLGQKEALKTINHLSISKGFGEGPFGHSCLLCGLS